jgi:hypothetical protein
MYYQYGRLNQQSGLQSWDAVVPHFLDPSDFPFDPGRKPAGYLLFLGTLSQAKGVDLAMQIARASGLPLVVAGQAESGPQVQDWLSGLAAKAGNGVRWVGPVDHARRCELLAGAVALVNPVRWVEPFGMVNIESLAMGCPVIGPAFGSFPEILEPGVTGMLCRDLEEYVAAVDWAKRADRSACRAAAERRFSLDAVWPQYERHFQKIAKVGTKAGWSSRGQWPRGVSEGGEALPPRHGAFSLSSFSGGLPTPVGGRGLGSGAPGFLSIPLTIASGQAVLSTRQLPADQRTTSGRLGDPNVEPFATAKQTSDGERHTGWSVRSPSFSANALTTSPVASVTTATPFGPGIRTCRWSGLSSK